jgi:hypothetical protein
MRGEPARATARELTMKHFEKKALWIALEPVKQVQLCREKGLSGVCFYDYFNLLDWSAIDRAAVVAVLNGRKSP